MRASDVRRRVLEDHSHIRRLLDSDDWRRAVSARSRL